MSRGVDVTGNPFRLQRLKAWYFEELMQDWHRTMLLVAASRPGSNSTDLGDLARKYRESLFPSGKTNEELVARFKDVLASQENTVLEVRALDS